MKNLKRGAVFGSLRGPWSLGPARHASWTDGARADDGSMSWVGQRTNHTRPHTSRLSAQPASGNTISKTVAVSTLRASNESPPGSRGTPKPTAVQRLNSLLIALNGRTGPCPVPTRLASPRRAVSTPQQLNDSSAAPRCPQAADTSQGGHPGAVLAIVAQEAPHAQHTALFRAPTFAQVSQVAESSCKLSPWA